MRRLAFVALVALLFVPVARGQDSIAVRASLTPRSHLFGDAVTAEIEVVVDAEAAASVRVKPDFRPYAQAVPVQMTRSGDGRSVELHFRYTLDCLERECLPGDTRRRFVFTPARVFARIAGRDRAATAHWPVLTARSRLAPEDVARQQLRSSVYPGLTVSYRVAPGLLFWTLAGAAGVLALGGIAVVVGLVLGVRVPWRRDRFGRLAPVERALVLVRLAARRGDPPRRRQALERLGHELEQGGQAKLGEEACRLAWAEAAPDADSLLALAGRVERELAS